MREVLLLLSRPPDVLFKELYANVFELLENFLQFFMGERVDEGRISKPRVPTTKTLKQG